MKSKNFISLSVAFAFLTLAITGILLYVKQKVHFIEITHTIFGLLFIGFAVFHIINNWSSIVGYSKERRSGKIQKELWIALGIGALVLAGALTELLEPIAEAGRVFAAPRPQNQEKEKLAFELISTRQKNEGTSLQLYIQKAKGVERPVLAIWVEDTAGKFVENLFIPSKIALKPEGEEAEREARFRGKYPTEAFKADLLADWNKKTADKTPNFEGITPTESFTLETKTSAKGVFRVKIEVKGEQKNETLEALVDNNKSEVFKLKGKDNTLISKALVELK
jgi:hypothetical protein